MATIAKSATRVVRSDATIQRKLVRQLRRHYGLAVVKLGQVFDGNGFLSMHIRNISLDADWGRILHWGLG